jgi:hypothetical protein
MIIEILRRLKIFSLIFFKLKNVQIKKNEN